MKQLKLNKLCDVHSIKFDYKLNYEIYDHIESYFHNLRRNLSEFKYKTIWRKVHNNAHLYNIKKII